MHAAIPALLLALLLSTPAVFCLADEAYESAAPLQLAKTYSRGDSHIDIKQYWVSEKLDGIRARWTGHKLISRNGLEFHPPADYTSGFPDTPLDGELWTQRQGFQNVAATVRDQHPDPSQWERVKLMIFDLPSHPGTFSERITAMRQLIRQNSNPHLHIITQFRVDNEAALLAELEAVENLGGEGLMLQHQHNHYRNGRTDALLKVKSYEDAEARVEGYTQGKGKYSSLVGALRVVTPDGVRFKLGSGLSNEDRHHPPEIGSLVTYKYYGKTRAGKPRFASFLRVREAAPTSRNIPASTDTGKGQQAAGE